MGRDRDGAFRVTVANRGDEVVVQLFGELDLVTIAEFEGRLQSVLDSNPARLTFDVTSAGFISAEGYAVIGGSSRVVQHVIVRSLTALPSKVFGVLGYEDVQCEKVSHPPVGSEVQPRDAEETVPT
jgi:anti-anti-sigma regulatory factor